MNKRADFGVGIVLVILIVVLFLGWMVNEGWKECHNDSDCAQTQYCTSSFECREIPTASASPGGSFGIESAVILGASLILAALIIRWDAIFGKKKKSKQQEQSDAYNSEEKGEYEDLIEEH